MRDIDSLDVRLKSFGFDYLNMIPQNTIPRAK